MSDAVIFLSGMMFGALMGGFLMALMAAAHDTPTAYVRGYLKGVRDQRNGVVQ